MKIVLSGSPPDQQLLANVLPDGRLPMHMLPVLGIQGGTSSSSDDNAKVVYLPPLGSMEDASRFISTFTKCATNTQQSISKPVFRGSWSRCGGVNCSRAVRAVACAG